MLGSNEGYALGASYDLPMGLSFATVYNQAGKTAEQEKYAAFGGNDDAKLASLSENIIKLGLKDSADIIADEVVKLAWGKK